MSLRRELDFFFSLRGERVDSLSAGGILFFMRRYCEKKKSVYVYVCEILLFPNCCWLDVVAVLQKSASVSSHEMKRLNKK